MTKHSMPIPAEKALDRDELIERLAQALKADSDADLPHSFFVQQARLQLSGKQKHSAQTAANDSSKSQQKLACASNSVFCAWALPD